MVKHKLCKAKVVFSKMFEESAKKNGGARWYVFFEHADQTARIGLIQIAIYIDHCVQQKYSEESSKKAQTVLHDPVNFAMALVEIAAVDDGGRPLCQACYKCEGDAPLVFKAYNILSKLKTVIREEDEDFPWTLLQDAEKQGAALMKKEQDNFDAAIDAAEILVAKLKAQLDEATVNLE
jgi:hypothetical protein